MKYKPKFGIWELTNACNAKCLHCGSQSGKCRDNELTLEEVLRVCDELKETGCERITLMGGEFFLSPHWEAVCKRLVENNIRVAPLTNGLLLNEKNIMKLKELGIDRLGISIDGLEETHNYLRGVPNLFSRLIENLKKAQSKGFKIAIITAVSAVNLNQLPELYKFIKELGIRVWQVQIVEDVGNANQNSELHLTLEDVYKLAKYVAKFRREDNDMKILLGDNVGFYTTFEPLIRDNPFTGCAAGRQVVGITANGDIRGCLSVYGDKENIEGNIRERSFKDIWEDPNLFTVYRNRTVDKLTGFCAECKYNNLCRAGCSSLAYSLTGKFYENPFCLHKYEVENGLNSQ
ncbi:MAG: radical SAM protein [Halanaerobiales bacterium]|nr:radical SAM protein [Halanaerobiales bacterium]